MCVQCCFLPLVYCYSARRHCSSIAIQFVETDSSLSSSSFAVQHVGSSARQRDSSTVIQYVSSSVHRYGLLVRFVLLSSAHRFFSTSEHSSAVVQYVSSPMRGQHDCNMTLCGRRIARFAGGIPGRMKVRWRPPLRPPV